MRIDPSEKIAGIPIRQVRDFLRKCGGSSFEVGYVEEQFAVAKRRAVKITASLVSHGFLERDEGYPSGRRRPCYRLAKDGYRLANTRLVKRMDRAKATRLFNEFLARVQLVNDRPELTHYVAEVRAFGSFLTETDDIGDLDFAIRLARRQDDGEKSQARCLERARASGKRFSTYEEELFFSQNEVKRILRARSPYVSLHEMSELERLGYKSRQVFVSGHSWGDLFDRGPRVSEDFMAERVELVWPERDFSG
jgi:hypothetical protein